MSEWQEPKGNIVGLLPGSRNGEITRHLPVMLDAARQIARKTPDARFILPLATTACAETIDEIVAPYKNEIDIELATLGMATALDRCRAAVVASGTATLETALAGVPMVIIYKLSPLTYYLGRKLIRVDHIGLVNLIARERVAPELIQKQANPEAIALEIGRLIENPDHRHRVKTKLEWVRERLGTAGAARRVAQLALNLLPAA
jgi:lipid-A-disaccharide synthase